MASLPIMRERFLQAAGMVLLSNHPLHKSVSCRNRECKGDQYTIYVPTEPETIEGTSKWAGGEFLIGQCIICGYGQRIRVDSAFGQPIEDVLDDFDVDASFVSPDDLEEALDNLLPDAESTAVLSLDLGDVDGILHP